MLATLENIFAYDFLTNAFVVCVLGSFLALDLYEEYTSQFAGRNYHIDITID